MSRPVLMYMIAHDLAFPTALLVLAEHAQIPC
jgi:hypothetical protein